MLINEHLRSGLRIPYALRRVPTTCVAALGPCPTQPRPGDIAAARLEKLGKNTRLELAGGRSASLHEGDALLVVFGNRYATEQFEGYSLTSGETCDLLSMGGLCGVVASRHSAVAEPSRLRLLGTVLDRLGQPLRLSDYALTPVAMPVRPRVTIVCGTSMDAGKTYTAMSLIVGLSRRGRCVAGIKLTGTAAGRDTWSYVDAGARPALDFTDGGHPSTYMCEPQELLDLHILLLSHAAAAGAGHVVIEIADGLLQRETAALLTSRAFMDTVDEIVFATGDPLGALGGVQVLQRWGIRPVAISGVISQSPLAMKEAQAATGIRCLTAAEIQAGALAGEQPLAPAILNGVLNGPARGAVSGSVSASIHGSELCIPAHHEQRQSA